MAVKEAVRTAEKRVETVPGIGLRVCFVCTGNTCRSPMAEAVANSLARKIPAEARPEAFSAGLAVFGGEPISPNAVTALEDAGIEPVVGHDYRQHCARELTAEVAQTYDLLIGMTERHTMELLLRFPQLAGRITGMPEAIPDPYGGDVEIYRKSLEQILAGVRKLLFPEDGKP